MNFSQQARKGIDIWLNNKPNEAEEYFIEIQKNTNSVQIKAGYAFILCMNGIISYEVDKIQDAQNILLKLEKECETTNNGWLKLTRSNSQNESIAGHDSAIEMQQYVIYLEEQIILADTQLCLGILTFLMQDYKGYMKGCWMMRKAWKIYQKTYAVLNSLYTPSGSVLSVESNLSSEYDEKPDINRSKSTTSFSSFLHNKYNQVFSNSNTLQNTTTNKINNNFSPGTSNSSSANNILTKSKTINFNETNDDNKKLTSSFTQIFLKLNDPSKICAKLSINSNRKLTSSSDKKFIISNNLMPNEINRLMGAVSFGYGLFQVAISLLPPNLLKIISFFGFEGDSSAGLMSLQKTRESDDMRGPFATLSLLWYMTMGIQIFGIKEDKWRSSNEFSSSVEDILKDSLEKYPSSPLFLFFNGRKQRMQSNIPGAIQSFENAYNIAIQNEIKLICLHEIGWCRLIELNFNKAMGHFYEMGMKSKFSKSFYIYVTMILQGVVGNNSNALILRNEIQNIIARSCHKDTQIEKFILRRLSKIPDTAEDILKYTNEIFWKMLVYEMLYLWNSLNSCSTLALEQIIQDCSKANEELQTEPMVGLAKLIRGYCEVQLKNVTEAINSFSDCLETRKTVNENEPHDLHVSAFCNYELAMIYFKNEIHYVDAKELLIQIKTKFTNYDFENRLSIKVHQALNEMSIANKI